MSSGFGPIMLILDFIHNTDSSNDDYVIKIYGTTYIDNSINRPDRATGTVEHSN